MLVRMDTADLEAKLIERQGQLESAKAQLALAEKTLSTNQKLLKQNFISQTAFDSSESSMNVSRGSVMSAEAQVRLAQNALKDAVATAPLTGIVAKRHVQPGEKVAFDTPLVTVVDLKDIELQAMVPGGRHPGAPARHGGRARASTASASASSPGASSASIRRPSPARARSSCSSACPTPTASCAAACSRPAASRLRQARRCMSLPAVAVRSEAGQTFVWAIEDGKLVKRMVVVGRRDEESGRVEIKTALPRHAQGARRALRQPEGRRARAGQGAGRRPAEGERDGRR